MGTTQTSVLTNTSPGNEILVHPGYIEEEPNWQREKEGVDSIEHPTVPRQQRARILDPGSAFERRFDQISNLCRGVNANGEKHHKPDRRVRKKPRRNRVWHLRLE